ncbi:AMP-binding protein [Beijerinckia indica]|uniref:AMP-dependent synthetase and ligase n=1 Tax=Beijerinckia indica subsp. indica (strain ATCC 9039 / DSM 1715 / NCIMB 8712) TaxID=395963 RepID=B2IEC0_BEII9|nr:AMP-binding protein [Beijerinckia indica]ACB95518.1 AMP-dependent synthetase and ligase [Beijerinckia indica subsp. indica ATCC 9039]
MEPRRESPQTASPAKDDPRNLTQDLVVLVRSFVQELHPQRARRLALTLASRLEDDLGIDSLARTELILRVERAFHVRLPVARVGAAETMADLLRALNEALAGEGGKPADLHPIPALPLVLAATEAQTLTEVLDWHVARHPDRLHITLLQDDSTILDQLSYGRLAAQARQIARGLIARDIGPGDRVALMLPTSIEFFCAFFAILYVGAVPVPIYPPMRPSQIEDHLRRQAGILNNAGSRMLITMPEGLSVAALLRAQLSELESVASVAELMAEAGDMRLPPASTPVSTALIQYTSGSTGDPKGVILSHANLLANVKAMGAALEANSADVFVSWLPLYHDLGLIGAWFGCLYFGAPLYVMSPLSFLVRPESWLWAIHRFRATLSAAPNFGFELCTAKIDTAHLTGLDLSSLRAVANGAEPVSPYTLRRFTEKFAAFGFRPEVMMPVYGLAENAVGLAFSTLGRGPLIDRIDRNALMSRGVAEPAKANDQNPLELVACGRPLPGHEIRIVDPAGHEIGDRQEGRLEFRGPSATSGYFCNEAKTRDLIHDGWLDSGDRAYMAEGDVYITGRIKDIIIRAGRHIYPQEIEDAIATIPGIRRGSVAVFGMTDRVSGTERLVIVAETRETDPAARHEIETRAHELTSAICGTPPDEVVLAPPRTVPKTSSGKIRRSATRELYQRHQIGVAQGSLWLQVLRLRLAGLGPQFIRVMARGSATLYALWWWSVICLGYGLAWIAVMLLPRLEWRWAVTRAIGRIALAVLGIQVAVSGLDHIPPGKALLAFNHSSYLDVIILAAFLPGIPTFVAKKRFLGGMLIIPFLRRLGTFFVERIEMMGDIKDIEMIIAAARQSRMLVMFPEGTFTRRAGLAAFHLGAFKIASEADLPIVPGILQGTRVMLRPGQWFPRRAPLSLSIEEAIQPTGTDFSSVLQLEQQVRKVILTHCGEPDLGEST